MIAEYICKGLLIGLIFGVPAGAIGALTIGRTLEKGFVAGLALRWFLMFYLLVRVSFGSLAEY